MSDLNPRITISVDNEPVEIFMSFALLKKLAALVEDLNAVGAFLVDPEVQTEMVQICLTKWLRNGRAEHEFDPDEVEISVEDVSRLGEWVFAHVMDFFLRSLEAAAKVAGSNKERLASLMSSAAGSLTLTSETPSAGPTE